MMSFKFCANVPAMFHQMFQQKFNTALNNFESGTLAQSFVHNMRLLLFLESSLFLSKIGQKWQK